VFDGYYPEEDGANEDFEKLGRYLTHLGTIGTGNRI
jgi:hypothetical protein